MLGQPAGNSILAGTTTAHQSSFRPITGAFTLWAGWITLYMANKLPWSLSNIRERHSLQMYWHLLRAYYLSLVCDKGKGIALFLHSSGITSQLITLLGHAETGRYILAPISSNYVSMELSIKNDAAILWRRCSQSTDYRANQAVARCSLHSCHHCGVASTAVHGRMMIGLVGKPNFFPSHTG